MKSRNVNIVARRAVVRLATPHVTFGELTERSEPEETSFKHEQDRQLLLTPKVSASDTHRLVRCVHHGYEHIDEQDNGDYGVKNQQQTREVLMARTHFQRLLLSQIEDDIHHVVEDLDVKRDSNYDMPSKDAAARFYPHKKQRYEYSTTNITL